MEELVAETNALRDSYTTEDGLAVRVQYLQQHYPRTIAYINDKLENAIDKKYFKRFLLHKYHLLFLVVHLERKFLGIQ